MLYCYCTHLQIYRWFDDPTILRNVKFIFNANIQCALKINELKLHKKSIYKRDDKNQLFSRVYLFITSAWKKAKKTLPFAFR